LFISENKKSIFLLGFALSIVIGVVLLFRLNGRISELNVHKEETILEGTGLESSETDFIVLEVPIIEYENGNVISEPIIKGYSQQKIKQKDEFIIDSATLGYRISNSVGDIKLKLVDILPDSIIVDILADVRLDGNFYQRDEFDSHKIKDGSCINAFPLVVDAYFKYCFDLYERDSIKTLKYRIEEESTMPSPN